MTEPIDLSVSKPGYHRVAAAAVRAWRSATNTDIDKPICGYCDEDKKPLCSQSCGTYIVWVDTSTLAQITLDMS